MSLLLHPFTRERKKNAKNENAKERKKRRRKKKTQKNEEVYFQERKSIFSRTKTHKKMKTKTQRLGERCQLSSGEYCTSSLLYSHSYHSSKSCKHIFLGYKKPKY